MAEDIKLVLEELKKINGRLENIEGRQDEIKEIVASVRHAQEITNAKLEALTMDVRKIQGDVEVIKEHKEDMEFLRRIRKAAFSE